MMQHRSTLRKPKTEGKSWIRLCLYAGIGLLALSGILYGYHYVTTDKEFYPQEAFFGKETYKELFTLEQKQSKFTDLTQKAEEALAFVGTEAEAQEAFGILAQYCATAEGAAESRYTMDVLNAGISGTTGHLWLAYTQEITDANGTVLESLGTETTRILSRWSLEQQDGTWVITEIQENTQAE